MIRQTLVMAAVACTCTAAQAADLDVQRNTGGPLSLSASLGYLTGEAHERVYDNGTKVSQLDWDMQGALALNGGLVFRATERFGLYGNVAIGLDGDNYMDDYDWIGAPPPADPDMHSWHPDTTLDHYYTIDAGASFALASGGPQQLLALGGFKYTDIQWTARGGCYDYKYSGTSGCGEDGVKSISYRQSLPVIYGGLDYQVGFDRWLLGLQGKAGLTLASAEADDHHWLRDLRFVDDLDAAPYIAIAGRAGYAVTEQLDLVGSVAYDKFFELRGAMTVTDKASGESARFKDAAGDELYTLNVALGVDYKF